MKLKPNYCFILILSIVLSSFSERSMAQAYLTNYIQFALYPAGRIVNTGVERVAGDHHALHVQIGFNFAQRKDFSGLNDNEYGYGPGLSFGYRFYKNYSTSSWYIGLRSDYWRMKIHWKDSSEFIKNGRTIIDVLQPTLEVGYSWKIKDRLRLGVAVVNGFEVNVRTKGEEVGQGFISLLQLRLSKNLR